MYRIYKAHPVISRYNSSYCIYMLRNTIESEAYSTEYRCLLFLLLLKNKYPKNTQITAPAAAAVTMPATAAVLIPERLVGLVPCV